MLSEQLDGLVRCRILKPLTRRVVLLPGHAEQNGWNNDSLPLWGTY